MKTLLELRETIDTIDNNVLELIAQRRAIVQEVGEFKKTDNIAIKDSLREKEKLNQLEKTGETLSIPKTLIENIWKVLFNDAYEIEK